MKLEGVKVLDLSAFLPGPHMTMMMADHGANVVMVEPDNGRGEPARDMGEKYPDGNSCLLYTSPSPRDQRGSRMPSSA